MRLTIGSLLISELWRGNGAFGEHPRTKARENEPAICGTPHCSGRGILRSALRRKQDGRLSFGRVARASTLALPPQAGEGTNRTCCAYQPKKAGRNSVCYFALHFAR